MSISNNVVVMSLECKLTKEEFIERSKELAYQNTNKAKDTFSKAEMTSQYNSKIKSAEAQIDYLSRTISSGKETREIDCIWDYDYENNEKTLTRTDTNVIIEIKKLTQEELQMNIPEV